MTVLYVVLTYYHIAISFNDYATCEIVRAQFARAVNGVAVCVDGKKHD